MDDGRPGSGAPGSWFLLLTTYVLGTIASFLAHKTNFISGFLTESRRLASQVVLVTPARASSHQRHRQGPPAPGTTSGNKPGPGQVQPGLMPRAEGPNPAGHRGRPAAAKRNATDGDEVSGGGVPADLPTPGQAAGDRPAAPNRAPSRTTSPAGWPRTRPAAQTWTTSQGGDLLDGPARAVPCLVGVPKTHIRPANAGHPPTRRGRAH